MSDSAPHDTPDLDALDLSALLCSRVCHDVISPVGAIANGLEVLDEDDSEEMRAFALDLIKKSARQASAKLQFARLAFGAAGSAGSMIDLADAEAVARGMIESDKLALDWEAPPGTMAKNAIKLLLNLVLVAAATIPRGGRIAVAVGEDLARPTFQLTATGRSARIPADLERMLTRGQAEHAVDAHSIQPYYTRQLAGSVGLDVTLALDEDTASVRTRPTGEADAEGGASASIPAEDTRGGEV